MFRAGGKPRAGLHSACEGKGEGGHRRDTESQRPGPGPESNSFSHAEDGPRKAHCMLQAA